MSADPSLPPIIAFDFNDWFGEMKNRQQLLGRLAGRGWRVVYDNGPLGVWDRGRERWQRASWRARKRRAGEVTVFEAGRVPPRWPRLPAWDRFALRHHARALRAAAGAGPGDDVVGFVFHPTFADVIDALAPRWLAFHHRDAYSAFPGWSAADDASFRRLNRDADLLTLCAAPLAENLDEESRRRARVLENAADAALFAAGSEQRVPDELAAIPHPRIGYVGSITLKIDLDLIDAVSARRQDWHWVIIGPVARDAGGLLGGDAERDALWRELIARPNIHHLGERPYPDLPAYVAHVDVNTMVYRTHRGEGGWARFAVPLKLYEGLATGVPMVSCPLEGVSTLGGVLETAEGADEWCAALERAIRGDAPGDAASRQAVALANTWDVRVDELDGWLRAMVGAEGVK